MTGWLYLGLMLLAGAVAVWGLGSMLLGMPPLLLFAIGVSIALARKGE